MSEPLIRMKGLTKTFRRDGSEIQVLRGIDLQVFPGDFVSLMGPSGSGKSTLLNIIAGIDRPSGGELHVLDAEILSMSEDELATWRNHHVGFVFQHFNLIPVLTAFGNVELPLLLTSLSRKERREHVMTALKLVGLTDRADHYPRQLSGGRGTASRHRPGHRHRPDIRACRRADGRSGRRIRDGGDEGAGGVERAVQEDRHPGDARPACRRIRVHTPLPGQGRPHGTPHVRGQRVVNRKP